MRNIMAWHWLMGCCAIAAMLGCGLKDPMHKGAEPARVKDTAASTIIKAGGLTFQVVKAGFRFSFASRDGLTRVAPHAESGLQLGSPDKLEPVSATEYLGPRGEGHAFAVKTSSGQRARITVRLAQHHAWFQVDPETAGLAIVARVGAASPGYGLGDNQINAICKSFASPVTPGGGTEITGFSDDDFRSGEMFIRCVSNFAIYPAHGFAVINLDPLAKIVRSTPSEVAQGSRIAGKITDLHFFFGPPRRIYQEYLAVRNTRGYQVMKPDYEFFGVGWEAWGALAWDTNQKTVREDVDHYLDLGFPFSWMIIGSGFWDHVDPRYMTTTSFGRFDPQLYPDPQGLIKHFHDRGLKVIFGLRISFITNGMYAEEGRQKGYFIKENGQAKVFNIAFPKSPVHLLDDRNPEAVRWYVELCKKWGVDGFKEDLFGYSKYPLRDDKVNAVNTALKEGGWLMMERNAYVGSHGELHRIEDFNYDQDQDRGPINSLTLAYSGFPFTYPDLIGGLFGGMKFEGEVSPRIRVYLMRNSQWAALHSAMAFGKGPWNFGDERLTQIMLEAARLHARLHPYIYSQAIRFYQEGFPWTMAPLPIVFPKDPAVHGRENNKVRGYQWMVGDALLATPLYGNDYDTATQRDVYLPTGEWIEYDSGARHVGPTMLRNYPLPAGKTPLFVGGTGLVVEQDGARLVCRTYPVGGNSETVFWHRDGKTRSLIRKHGLHGARPVVTDTTTGRKVAGAWVRHAWQFPIEPGHDYRVN